MQSFLVDTWYLIVRFNRYDSHGRPAPWSTVVNE